MASPRAGTARALVYDVLGRIGPEASAAAITRAVGDGASRASIDQALANGVKHQDITRVGEHRAYRYTLVAVEPEATGAVPPPVAKAVKAPPAPEFAPALGTRCTVLPDNPSQGTIAQALRAVLAADVAMPLNEVFLAVPLGWSRTEVLSGLKEAALDGWVNYGVDGWQLAGDPPETRAEDPLAVARIPNHAQHRLQELSGGVSEQLSDAVRLGRTPHFVRALAIAHAELATALQLLDSAD